MFSQLNKIKAFVNNKKIKNTNKYTFNMFYVDAWNTEDRSNSDVALYLTIFQDKSNAKQSHIPRYWARSLSFH